MSDTQIPDEPITGPVNGPSRRGFLRTTALAGAGLVTGAVAARAEDADPLITEVQPWAQGFGDGVDATPYGLPIRFESDVIRRNVPWLTADVDQLNQLHADPCA